MKNKTQRGEVYLSEGDSLAKNHLFQKALLRLKKAHQMGCESAACKIGKIYMSSDFKDYEQAFSWLRLGAESGDREAQYYLSKFYEFDLLDKYDLNEAHKWLQKSADQDEVRAIMRLSYWYRFGRYGVPDMEKGWKLLQRAAGLGSADALFQLAVIYEHGNEMVESDLPEESVIGKESISRKICCFPFNIWKKAVRWDVVRPNTIWPRFVPPISITTPLSVMFFCRLRPNRIMIRPCTSWDACISLETVF